MDATKTTTNDKAPAKPLSPAELADELMNLADDAVPWKLNEEVEEAERALAAARARVDRAGEKKLRILRAKSIEEAQAILAENPADVNLKKLCQRLSGWKPLQEKGATDEEIKALLTKRPGGWPDYRPYPHAMPSAQGGYGSPAAWVDPDKGAEGKAHLEGQKLLDAVRRVMSVPKPAAPTKPAAKKAAPAKKGGTKAPAAAAAAKAPADGGGDDDDAGGAKASAAATVAPVRFVVGPDGKQRTGHRQTWGQWAATLRGIPGGPDLSPGLETKLDPTTQERFFLEQFLKGARPADARDAWKKAMAVEKSLAAPPAGSDEAEAERFGDSGPKSPASPIGLRTMGYDSWGQFCTLLRSIEPDGIDVEQAGAEAEAFFRTHYDAGVPAGAALDAWHARPKAEAEAEAEPGGADHADAACRVCGCTEDDCAQCVRKTGGPCRWVDDPILMGDLCSACKPPEYGRRVTGPDVNDPAEEVEGLVVGRTEWRGKPAYQVRLDNGLVVPCYVVGAEVWPVTERRDAGEAPAAPDDPNVDGRGVFVGGVREVWVTGTAKGDGAKIVIRVARGADELYRTGYLLAFPGAEAWHADRDEPVKWFAQGAETEAYAIRTRAQKLIGTIRAAPGSAKGKAWTAEQKRVYGAAIDALEHFVANNPACREPGEQAQAKAG